MKRWYTVSDGQTANQIDFQQEVDLAIFDALDVTDNHTQHMPILYSYSTCKMSMSYSAFVKI